VSFSIGGCGFRTEQSPLGIFGLQDGILSGYPRTIGKLHLNTKKNNKESPAPDTDAGFVF